MVATNHGLLRTAHSRRVKTRPSDSDKFQNAFGDNATPLNEAILATAEWFNPTAGLALQAPETTHPGA